MTLLNIRVLYVYTNAHNLVILFTYNDYVILKCYLSNQSIVKENNISLFNSNFPFKINLI